MRNIRFFSVALCAVWIGSLYMGQAVVPKAAHAAEPIAAVVATSSRSRNPGFSNMWIGKGFGLFAKDTLDVTIYGANGHAESLQLLMSDRVHLSVGVQDSVLKAMAEGRSLPVVAACDYTRAIYNQTFVKHDSPIKNFADLAGRKVGVPSLAAQQLPYVTFSVRSVGGNPDTIQFIAVGGGQQAAVALTSDKVDAVGSFDVAVARLKQLGAKIRVLDNPPAIQEMTAGQVFAFHRSWYEDNKDAVVALLQGMIKSMILAVENPEAAVRMSFKMYPESVPNGVPFETAVKEAVELLEARSQIYRKEVGGLKRWCEFSPEAWNSYVALMGLKGKVDPSKFYTNELVERINDFDEAAFRKWARSVKAPN